MTANIIELFSNDFFKLFVIFSSITILGVVCKNFFDKKKFISEFKNDLNFEKVYPFNAKRTIEIHVNNLDPRFELIAKLECVNQSDFPLLAIEKLENIIRVGHKSIRLSYRVLGSLGSSKTFYVGMLLVNRHGVLTLIEHLEFTEILNSISKEYDLKLKLDNYASVVQKLKPLKSQLYKLDGKLALTITFNQLPSKTAMNSFANKFNLVLYAEDRFIKIDIDSCPEFSIVPADYVYGLNIIMDLPRVKDPEKVFNNMFEIAEWLVFNFDGCLTDEKGLKIKNDSKSIISNQILNKIQLLNKYGLPPGGELSLRVFN